MRVIATKLKRNDTLALLEDKAITEIDFCIAHLEHGESIVNVKDHFTG